MIILVGNSIVKFDEHLLQEKKKHEIKMNELRAKKQRQIMENKMIEENYRAGSGNKVFFILHDQWKIVIAIMTGIEMSVRAFDYERKQYSPTEKDFKMKNIFEIHHPSLELYKLAQFIDYAPTIFHYFRKINGIFPDNYLESLGPECLAKIISGNAELFQGLGSTGKSGSFFFTSSDKRYLVKTIKQAEYDLIMDILPKYFKYVTNNPNSLINKIFGLHRIIMKSVTGVKEEWTIIVMQNIFCTFLKIDKLYDLKGSTYKRYNKAHQIDKAGGKDLNFIEDKMKYFINSQTYQEIRRQIKHDSSFLKTCNLIDYSLLLGICDRNKKSKSPSRPRTPRGGVSYEEAVEENLDMLNDYNNGKTQGPVLTSDNRYFLFFGIIDVFTKFTLRKTGEYISKKILFGKGVSCIPPEQYAERFYQFMTDTVFGSIESKPTNIISDIVEDEIKPQIDRESGSRKKISSPTHNQDLKKNTHLPKEIFDHEH